MKYLLLILFCIALFTYSCRKDSATTIVMLRVENTTGVDFVKVITNNSTYSNVLAGDVTDYKTFNKIVTAPFAEMITTDNDTLYGGYVFIDNPLFYDSGHYTLKIFTDSTTGDGYNCSYIHD